MLSPEVKFECISHLMNQVQQSNEALQKGIANMSDAIKRKDLIGLLEIISELPGECNALRFNLETIWAVGACL